MGPQQKPQQSKLLKQNTAPDIQRNQEKKTVNSNTKNRVANTETSSKKKGVEKWDFKPATPKNRGGLTDLDSSIDPELDVMLAELEMDEDFKKLNDNDQLTWLESLFYLDTPSKQSQSKLVKPKPKEELPKRREKTALSLYSRNKDDSKDDKKNEDG